jgi:hypothetical protein
VFRLILHLQSSGLNFLWRLEALISQLAPWWLFGLLFDLRDGDKKFLRNVDIFRTRLYGVLSQNVVLSMSVVRSNVHIRLLFIHRFKIYVLVKYQLYAVYLIVFNSTQHKTAVHLQTFTCLEIIIEQS